MERKNVTARSEQYRTRFIGFAVPMSLHEEIRDAAKREGITASRLYLRAIVEFIDRRKR